MNPFWRPYFSKGLVQPTTSWDLIKDSLLFLGGDVLGFGDFCWLFWVCFQIGVRLVGVQNLLVLLDDFGVVFSTMFNHLDPLLLKGFMTRNDPSKSPWNRRFPSGLVLLEEKIGHWRNIKTLTRFFQVTLLGVLSDLFWGENVTSIWVIKRSLGRSWEFCLLDKHSDDST